MMLPLGGMGGQGGSVTLLARLESHEIRHGASVVLLLSSRSVASFAYVVCFVGVICLYSPEVAKAISSGGTVA